MDFMAWINVVMAVAGLGLLAMGIRILATGRVPRWYGADHEPHRIGKYTLCFALFWLLQVAGYLGVELRLFNSTVRFIFVISGFALLTMAIIRHRPRPLPRREAPND
ncbi:hypothetical protein AB0M54_37740 [Actinoplanes sp. NPDC051470]|uniref:hypothetical protein n=1 Tax=unclassified Actinoplanes TaxID=2626549 RepID=UPI00343A8415